MHASYAPSRPQFAIKKVAALALSTAIFAVFSSFSNAAHAQNAAPMNIPQNLVTLAASATSEVQQDLLQINMSITKEGQDAAAVQAQLKAAVDAALAVAKPQVQDGQMEVRTGQFSLYPRHDRAGKISGWQGTAEVVLEGKDFARISQVAGRINTLVIANVGFGLSRAARQKAESAIQTEAIAAFKTKAEGIAKAFGFSGYTLREVNVNAADQGFTPQRGQMMQAKSSMSDSAVPVEAGKTQVTVQVGGSVQLR